MGFWDKDLLTKLKLVGLGPRNVEDEMLFMQFDTVDCGVVS